VDHQIKKIGGSRVNFNQ